MLRIGVDIGGTNTDAAVLCGTNVRGTTKVPTTQDIFTGFSAALRSSFQVADVKPQDVEAVMVGTTHFINAIITRTSLAKVSLLRLCGSATKDLPPFVDFPEELKTICVHSEMLPGSLLYDGRAVSEVEEERTRAAVRDALAAGAEAIAISGMFAPVLAQQEEAALNFVKRELAAASLSGMPVTLSSHVAGLGLLERENAAVLNAALSLLAAHVIPATQAALAACGCSRASLYMTRSDGTIMSAAESLTLPICCISCGPVNSLRGAALLSGIKDAIVVDVGGTTTDVGAIVDGFPVPSSFDAYIGGVRTNFPVPSVQSIGIGGGSIVALESGSIGPKSVGHELFKQALAYGGDTCTASDVALLLERAPVSLVSNSSVDRISKALTRPTAEAAWSNIQEQIIAAIDRCKLTPASVPLILVGGGAFLVQDSLPGVHAIHRPQHADSANAVGAASAHISGLVDSVVQLGGKAEEQVVDGLQRLAIDRAVAAGASRESCQVIVVEKIPMAYLPGDTMRMRVCAVGELQATADALQQPANVVDALPKENALGESSAATPLPDSAAQKRNTAGDDNGGGRKRHCPNPLVGATPSPPRPGEWVLAESDLDAMELGVGLLGTGGGGAPRRAKLALLQAIRSGLRPRVVLPDNLPDVGLIVEGGFMGAPTVGGEMLMAGEAAAAVRAVLSVMEGEAAAVISGEIGGSNGLIQCVIAAQLGLPVVDGDYMGTAFPRLDQGTNAIYCTELTPVGLADHMGNSIVVKDVASPAWLENLLRPVSTMMGCRAGLAFVPLSGKEVKRICMRHTLSQAYYLGTAILEALATHKDPVNAAAAAGNGEVIFAGKIHNVNRKTTAGFAKGNFVINGHEVPKSGTTNGIASDTEPSKLRIDFQNEFLVATVCQDGVAERVVACVPDLVCLLETSTGRPLQTEELRYGLLVSVVVLPAHPLHHTPKALAVVGPRAFGYDLDWTPTMQYVEPRPLTRHNVV